MAKRLLVVFIVLTFASAALAQKGALQANDIIKNLDIEKKTKAQLKEYYQTVRGKTAVGSGKVVDVISGRGGYKVTILTTASDPEKGYNVVLYCKGETPGDLGKGHRVSFEGEVGRYSTFRGLSIDIMGGLKR